MHFALKFTAIAIVLIVLNPLLVEINIENWEQLLAASVILAAIVTWLDQRLLESFSQTTSALIDLFVAALVLYGLQFLLPLYYMDSSGALTAGLLIACLEWLHHRSLLYWRRRR
ncbi:hypothetical protein GCM10011571_02740 [Marinithermofilum abyssi]|uniref:DUF2512 family protein n=1 Tax=Marinithermofilum abyssi TaxID=1571185 RepID=A0A8J2VFT8_9BACL|nr:DUF2512 family protein [Marinithermofilum abyssi]GGE05128.1 hypothetical protein GCM10011571_02740 [Marinithermofilum abyssi]